jgi:hypothetical protein
MSCEVHVRFCERREVRPLPATHLLLGFAGPKAEAEEIKRRLAQFLHDDLKLELSETKTLITHARTSVARFLGYEITTQHANQIITDGRRVANGSIRLRVPGDVIKTKCSRYMSRGKPERRPELLNDEDYSIISRYGNEYRGIVQYYLLAGDVHRLDRLHWVMVTSLLKTLAGKYDSSVSKMARKYRATIETPHGRADACRSASTEARTASRWSQPSVVSRYGGRRTRSSGTAIQSEPPPAARNWFTGSLPDDASSADRRTRCACTRSASSQTSTSPDSQTNPNGCKSWRDGDARPWWSAPPATPTSTTGAQPHQPRNSHWRAR